MLDRHHLPETIDPVPTAQTISDALSVSEYMDHVVDHWIGAHVNLRIAAALNKAANEGKDISEQVDTDDYKQAKAAFDVAYAEMLQRWNELRSLFKERE